MLEEIKKLLGMNNTEYDSIIQGFVKSCQADLVSVGIASSLVYSLDGEDPDELIKTAVLTYVKANFDEEARGALGASYDLQKENLRRKAAYQEVVS